MHVGRNLPSAWFSRVFFSRPVGHRILLPFWMGMGALLASMFPPSPLGWLAPLPLALLFRTVATTSSRQALSVTFTFALGFFALHLMWLPSGLSRLLGPGVLVLYPLLVMLLALFWAVTAGLTRRWLGRFTLWGLPLAWVLLDAARAWGPFGFTWGSLGYAWAQTPFVQVADLGGLHLVGLLVGLTAAVLASGPRHPRVLTGGALLLFLAGGYALSRPEVSKGDRQVLLIQGNIDPRTKVEGRAQEDLRTYTELTRQALGVRAADLAVWPETASPAPPTQPEVSATLASLNVPLLIGAPTWGEGYWNSAYAFEKGNVMGRQDKVRLVPFGEFFPARQALDGAYRAVFRALRLPAMSGTTPGTVLSPLAVGRVSAGVLICYESTFPEFARALVRRGADVLVTLSNDAWFGPSVGAEQHFQMGRVRAIETRRWWVRAGNDGVTAVVRPSGDVAARYPRAVQGALHATFGTSQTLTPYVRFGDWVPLLSILLLAALVSLRLVEAHWAQRPVDDPL